jgi:hypothetical protein
MVGEIVRSRELEANPEEIEGHDFRIPSIQRAGDFYQLYGIHLPYNWEANIPRLKEVEPDGYGRYLDRLCREGGREWKIEIDDNTGLVFEVKLGSGEKQSSVYLDTGIGASGVYRGKEITSLRTAIIYQNFLATYLSQMSDFQERYAYIIQTESGCGSNDLIIPEQIRKSEGSVTNEAYRQDFLYKAHYISGEFGRKLRYIKFDDKGLVEIVQIDSDDCNYILDNGFYYPHNVDNIFQAATLHGIVAEFINDQLKKNSPEGWR